MCPHGPSRSLELWDALKESGTAPFAAGISPDGILQLCSLAFYFIFLLSLFSPLLSVHVPCFRNGRAEGSSRCCCPGSAKGRQGDFPFGFLTGSGVSAEARGALVQRGRRAIFRATRAAAFPSTEGWSWLAAASLQHHLLQEPVKREVKSNKENTPKSVGCSGGQQIL